MSSGKVLLGVLAGVAAGALLGVLFAPDKGWNTRKRISKKADDYAEELKDKFSEFLETISAKVEEAKEEASDFAEQADATVKELKKKVKTSTG
jgi:gas vesicle protein